jgi:membrane-bound lytic murein transglycosylase A
MVTVLFLATLVQVPAPTMGPLCDDLAGRDGAALADAIDREIAIFSKKPGTLQFGARAVTNAEYARQTLAPLAAAARQGDKALCAALQTKFTFWRNPDAGPGKFTAYHNPVLRASRTKKAPYLHPVYRRPPGPLAQLTTEQILKGGLDGKGLELFYFADATEVNALHVEGSASVQLDDGSWTAIGSDGHNGHPYQNVGKLVAADGKIPKDQQTPVGMTRARKYFIDHPAELALYWAKNPHYVFFKEKDGKGGAASGRFGPLTAGRSLAVDPEHVPLGAAVWFRTDMPRIDEKANRVAEWISYGRVALGQDTGAGIKGAGRVDVFFGTGDYAQAASAVTTRPGEIYVLLAK